MIQQGDTVYYFLTHTQPGLYRELTLRWIGPFTVRRVISDSLCIIYPLGTWSKNNKEIATLVNKLKKVENSQSFQVIRPQDQQQINLSDLSEEIDDAAEIISYGNTWEGPGAGDTAPPLSTPLGWGLVE